MLFFLTGDIQIGKTRWLQGIIGELEQADVPAYGVIAPGRWVERADGFEKLGIDNVLLPHGERVNFADPAERGWTFHESAIERVNGHLHDLATFSGEEALAPGLLVIDELGWMELLNDGGLTWAMRLLDAGSTWAFPHAVVVVRETLLPHAQSRFERADWHGVRIVHPTEADRNTVLDAIR